MCLGLVTWLLAVMIVLYGGGSNLFILLVGLLGLFSCGLDCVCGCSLCWYCGWPLWLLHLPCFVGFGWIALVWG